MIFPPSFSKRFLSISSLRARCSSTYLSLAAYVGFFINTNYKIKHTKRYLQFLIRKLSSRIQKESDSLLSTWLSPCDSSFIFR